MDKKRNFSSRWGFILSAVGSAVGMANVWGFPAKMGANGGFAFLVAYLFFVVLFTVHINVRIAMGDDMTLVLKVFGIPIKILPKKPKTYNPKNYTLKKIRKRDAKAAEKGRDHLSKSRGQHRSVEDR